MIKLYGVAASRAHRSLWMLEELGIEYEHVKTDFATGETRKPDYLEINPNGHIPAMVDGDTVLWESMAINLYLARKYRGSLQPDSLEAEAHATKWSIWAMTEVEPSLVLALRHKFMLAEDKRDPSKVDGALQALRVPLGVLDAALDGREFLLEGRFTVADLNVASVLSWTALVGFDYGPFPHAGRWFESCKSRDAFTKAQSL